MMIWLLLAALLGILFGMLLAWALLCCSLRHLRLKVVAATGSPTAESTRERQVLSNDLPQKQETGQPGTIEVAGCPSHIIVTQYGECWHVDEQCEGLRKAKMNSVKRACLVCVPRMKVSSSPAKTTSLT